MNKVYSAYFYTFRKGGKNARYKSNCNCKPKGGVGKTTTTLSLELLLQRKEKGFVSRCRSARKPYYLSRYNKLEEMPIRLTEIMNAEMMDEKLNINDGILHHKEGIDLIPSDLSLSGVELSLGNTMSREFVLKNCLNTIKIIMTMF